MMTEIPILSDHFIRRRRRKKKKKRRRRAWPLCKYSYIATRVKRRFELLSSVLLEETLNSSVITETVS